MPFLEFRQQLYPLHKGENSVGPGGGAEVRLPELPSDCALEISVEEGSASIRRTGGNGKVSVNGRPIGGESVPLFDGDQITIEDAALVFPLLFVGDARRNGPPMPGELDPAPASAADPAIEAAATTAIVDPELMRRQTPPQAERKTVTALRRLDTNECYVIEGSSFRIGRERHCDLVIPDPSVSRLHAEVTLAGGRYVLREHGRTPTLLNDREVHGQQVLNVGDVIAIGQFRLEFVRRPAGASDLVAAPETTPVRSAVPDAPTVVSGPAAKRKKEGEARSGSGRGSRGFQVVLLLLLAALLGVILLG